MFKFKTLWVSVDQWLPISMFSSRHKLPIFHFFQLRHQEPRRVTSRLQHFVQLGQVPGEKKHGEIHPQMWHFGTWEIWMLRKKNQDALKHEICEKRGWSQQFLGFCSTVISSTRENHLWPKKRHFSQGIRVGWTHPVGNMAAWHLSRESLRLSNNSSSLQKDADVNCTSYSE